MIVQEIIPCTGKWIILWILDEVRNPPSGTAANRMRGNLMDFIILLISVLIAGFEFLPPTSRLAAVFDRRWREG